MFVCELVNLQISLGFLCGGVFFVGFGWSMSEALAGGEKPKCNLPSSLAFLVPPHFAVVAIQLVLAWFENPKRGRSVLAFTAAINMLKNRRHPPYDKKNKDIITLFDPLNKGAIEKNHTYSSATSKISHQASGC